ncbi:MAG TPA: FAD-dependent oxidoreductase, partial [Nevskiaceae bacterium]|nr:FAD-dependent oxidoreductase [Nevskiaceae bacterium]
RFTLDVVAAAQSAGAACANHLAAAELLRDAGRVVRAVVHDDQTGARFELRASAVVVAAGPWAGTFAGSAAPDIERVRGAHLILPAIPGCDRALVLAAPQDGRAFFVVPWYGRSLVGTTESFVSADHYAQPVAPSAQTRASLAEQRYLLEAVAAHLPGLGWTDSDVIASYAGVRSLRRAATSDLSAISREFELLTPSPGLWLPLGGKLTTARREARGVVDTLLQSLGFAPRPCRTGHTPLPGAPTAAFAEWHAAEMHELGRRAPVLDPRVLASLLNRYGTRARHIIERLQEDPRLAVRLHPELPFIAAEIRVAQDEEMALAAEDITRRRIPLAILARAGEWEATAQAWIDPR